MKKHVAFALFVLVALGVTAALAAPPAKSTGKIVAVGENEVQISLEGEKAAWIKKSAPVKFADGVGKILAITDEGVTPVVITVKTKLAPKMKVDDAVIFEKGKSMAGC